MPNEVKLLPCDCSFVLGGVHYDGEIWTAEVQMVGGYEVVAEVYSDSEENAVERQIALFRALCDSEAEETTRPTTVVTDEVVERVARVIRGDHAPHAPIISEYAATWLAKRIAASLASMPIVVTGEQPLKSVGAIPGSHPADQAPSGLGASRFDPERSA